MMFYKNKRKAEYKGIRKESIYITMRDGVKLATDIYLPKNLADGERIPSIITFSRYWRDIELRIPFKWFYKIRTAFVKFGYAEIFIDIRGSGASTGSNKYPWFNDEIDDTCDVIKWISEQKWSNGEVGFIGNSYNGNVGEISTRRKNPSLKGVIPTCNLLDSYSGIAFPGGIFNEWFIKEWGRCLEVMDKGIVPDFSNILGPFGFILKIPLKGAKTIDSDKGKVVFKQAIQEHKKNNNVYNLSQNVRYKDDVSDNVGISINDFSIHSSLKAINESNIPMIFLGGWTDAGVADSIIMRFLTYPNFKKGIIGPWNHGLVQNVNPYSNTLINKFSKEIFFAELEFFDKCLKNKESNSFGEKSLYYYTLGENKWKITTKFPIEKTEYKKFYFSDNNPLVDLASESNDEKKDVYG